MRPNPLNKNSLVVSASKSDSFKGASALNGSGWITKERNIFYLLWGHVQNSPCCPCSRHFASKLFREIIHRTASWNNVCRFFDNCAFFSQSSSPLWSCEDVQARHNFAPVIFYFVTLKYVRFILQPSDLGPSSRTKLHLCSHIKEMSQLQTNAAAPETNMQDIFDARLRLHSQRHKHQTCRCSLSHLPASWKHYFSQPTLDCFNAL